MRKLSVFAIAYYKHFSVLKVTDRCVNQADAPTLCWVSAAEKSFFYRKGLANPQRQGAQTGDAADQCVATDYSGYAFWCAGVNQVAGL